MSGEIPSWIQEIVEVVEERKEHELDIPRVRRSFIERILGTEIVDKIADWERKNFNGEVDHEDSLAPRKTWTIIFEGEDLTVWDTGGGIYSEKRFPDGNKMLTRILSNQEVLEIENKWPKA